MSDHGRSEMEELRSGRHVCQPLVPVGDDADSLKWFCWCGEEYGEPPKKDKATGPADGKERRDG